MAGRTRLCLAVAPRGLQAQQHWHYHTQRVVPLGRRLPAGTIRRLQPCTLHALKSSRAFSGFSIEWGIPLQADGPITPVTMLSGFLGAGKTTLLKRLLENRSGLRVGVIVNDVAAVNVDAQLIVSQVSGIDGVEVAELQNGCVCCSLADDLLTSVAEVLLRPSRSAHGGASGLDHLIIELSGVSEPEAIKKNWTLARELRHPAALRSQLARVVTVVDVSCFRADWLDGRNARQRNHDADAADSKRSIVELLATQIESADVVLLNKVDLVTAPEVSLAEAVVSGVNPSTELLAASYGEVDALQLLPSAGTTSKYDSDATSFMNAHAHGHSHNHGCSHGHGNGQGHAHDHGHTHGTSPAERYGIHSFVYKARRPFHASRFTQFVNEVRDMRPLDLLNSDSECADKSAMAGLLRAKGVCWIDDAPFLEHQWSFAGRTVTLARGDLWWAACSKQHLMWRMAYPGIEAVYERTRSNAWDESGEWGDQRQELVFIGGPNMNEALLQQRLDECLLREDEMALFRKEFLGKTVPFDMELGPSAM